MPDTAFRRSYSGLETFLGGMETPRGVRVHRHRPPLKPSLVEWKPPRSAGVGFGSMPLETFLGGMETYYKSFIAGRLNNLETFLGGMET